MRRYSKGDWVESDRVGSKGSFVGEVIGFGDPGEYIVRDPEKLRWLRMENELSPPS